MQHQQRLGAKGQLKELTNNYVLYMTDNLVNMQIKHQKDVLSLSQISLLLCIAVYRQK